MPGVLEKLGDYDSLIKTIDLTFYKKLKQKNIISDGMIPKLENCFQALKNGVDKVFIGSIDILNSEEKSTQLKI
jgi:acetylglutamate kinase